MGQSLSTAKNWKHNVAAGNEETKETGRALAEKQAQVNALRGAITPISTDTEPAYVASPKDLIHQAPIKGEHRIDTSSYSNPAIKTPVYDRGGEVKPYRQDSGRILAEGGDPLNELTKHTSASSGRNAKHQGVGQIALYDKGGDVNIVGGTNNNMTMRKLGAPVYDAGGTVNVNDGKHQLAILQEGERVLTPEQNQQYKKEHGMKGFNKIPVYDEGTPDVVVDPDKQQLIQPSLTEKQAAQQKVQNPGAQVISSDVPNKISAPKDELIPAQAIPASKPTPQPAQTTEPTKVPDELAAIKNAIDVDRKQGAGQGAKGLVKMGLANLYERNLIPEPSTSDVTGQITPTAAPTPAPRDMYQQTAGGPLIPTGGESETTGQRRDLANIERKARMQDFDSRIQAARNTGDETTADKLTVAKMEYQKNQPWQDRSVLSKIGKIAGTVGNIAGNIVAPSTMALIPGTQLNRAMREKNAYGRISQDTENDLKQAQADAANAKPTAQDTYKEATQGGIWNPATQRYEQAFVDEKDPSKIKFAGPMPPKAGSDKAETREQHLNRYAELQNQQASGAQLSDADQKELNTLKTELTVPKATMDSYNKQIDAALHSANVPQTLWNNYHVQPGATPEEAKQSIADARSFSGETFQQGAEGRTMDKEERAQERKDKATTVYAEDENGQLIKTNKADADKRGLVSEEMKAGDISKDRSAIRQLNDVQTNVNRYEKVIAEDLPKVSEEDRQLMTTILTIDKESAAGMLTADVNGKGISIGGAVFPQLSAELASRRLDLAREDLAKLSPEAQRVMNAYIRTASSVPTYLKALAGIGRSNKETLNLELANVPMPYFDQPTANGRMSAFQANIDQAKSGFPNNLPGMKLIESEREKSNIKPPAPADVEKSGTLNGQPVYQLKNGKTVYADGKPVEVK